MSGAEFDPRTDLRIARDLSAPPELVWRCWSDPDLFQRWFCPAPVEVADCALDLRPGGQFRTVMRLPDGTEMPSEGCFLEVVPERRLVFTDALSAGWRPGAAPFMAACVDLAPIATGTRYTAVVLHRTAEDRARHDAMGFDTGWGTALRQLEKLAESLIH